MSEAVQAPERPRAAGAEAAPHRPGVRVPALLVVAAGCLVLAGLVYVLALGVDDLLRADRELRFPQIVGDWRLRDEASYRFSQVTEIVFVASGVLLLLGTLVLGGVRRAGVVAAAAGAGPLAAWVLAAALGATDPVGGEALRASQGAFPSGHAAVAMSLGLGLVIALPPRGRVAGGIVATAFATSVAAGVMALGWHYPSDVLGALLVSIAAAALVVALAPAAGRSPVVRPGRSPWAPVALAGGAAALCAILGAVALDRLPDESAGAFADAHPRYIALVVVCAALSAAGAAILAHLCGTTRLRGS
ncbi:phosphatase PAP2 family protein [Miltoncostaea oceani]|uniref:phosphatase PAP2 family protein n=1 Tax=Miltoncostaea oceani TaxID=2843216 RepID=UPI001C3E1D2E|nr:phosphatase PAP2 family protein [Miltoncostaea oceani]